MKSINSKEVNTMSGILYPHQIKALADTASYDNVAYYLDMG